MNTISIYELADKMNATVWEKGSMRRIYLNDEGYNTKKMSTKTFIWQDENNDFRVSVHIECPSQPYQWIKSQEQEVREWVEEKIERILKGEEEE